MSAHTAATQRFRVTVRHEDVELRGYVDGLDALRELAAAVQPAGWIVMASPADAGYDPFR